MRVAYGLDNIRQSRGVCRRTAEGGEDAGRAGQMHGYDLDLIDLSLCDGRAVKHGFHDTHPAFSQLHLDYHVTSMGAGGASSVAGELATYGQSERASRHAACRPLAYIRVSFSPLPFVRPKNMHAHKYTCTYYIHLYTYLYDISIPA